MYVCSTYTVHTFERCSYLQGDCCYTGALQCQIKTFLLHTMQLKPSSAGLKQRNVIEILQDSLQDKPNHSLHGDQETYDEVRYKLIIDPSEDDSVSRLLLMYKILDPKKTRTFVCSDFPEDSHLQKVGLYGLGCTV